MRGGQDHDLLGIAMQQTAAATDAARFCASTIPLTEATFGYALFTSGSPKVIAPAPDDTTKVTTASNQDCCSHTAAPSYRRPLTYFGDLTGPLSIA